MKEVLEYVARAIVDDPDAVEVTEVSGERSLILQLRVAPDDMGKVIGKRGRTVRAIRSLVRAAGSRQGVTTLVEIVEGDSGGGSDS
ncbi:MAG: KH domain-containing protein [Actinomycetota bacterium]